MFIRTTKRDETYKKKKKIKKIQLKRNSSVAVVVVMMQSPRSCDRRMYVSSTYVCRCSLHLFKMFHGLSIECIEEEKY